MSFAAAAPFVAGGPPGWVVAGLIVIGSGALLMAASSEDTEDAAEPLDENEDRTEPCRDCEVVSEIEKEAGVEQRTKGRTKHGYKEGGMDEANQDFDRIGPRDVKDIDTKYGPGRTGTLSDGRWVTVRPGSSEGPATLEIRKGNRGSEIRYRP